MTDAPAASLTRDGVLARLTLERPEARNALSRAMADALEDALGHLAAADEVRVVVVAGRGRSFCAGADISEMPILSPAEAEALASRWQRIVDGFAALPQVTIAAVQGHALGGGLMLAIAQDLRGRLISIFLVGPDGRRPCFGWVERLQHDPAWKDNLVFNEYFHGDNAAGLGAAHQTGWTALVADLILDPPAGGGI